MPGRRLIALI